MCPDITNVSRSVVVPTLKSVVMQKNEKWRSVILPSSHCQVVVVKSSIAPERSASSSKFSARPRWYTFVNWDSPSSCRLVGDANDTDGVTALGRNPF